jgi:hypothetical protein
MLSEINQLTNQVHLPTQEKVYYTVSNGILCTYTANLLGTATAAAHVLITIITMIKLNY